MTTRRWVPLLIASAVGCKDPPRAAVAPSPVAVAPPRARDAGARVDAVVEAGVDAAVAPGDPVTYSGSFAVRAGRSHAQLRVADEARDVAVYLPSARGPAPPLVIAFHGTNGSGDVMLDESGAQAMADAHGVVVVAPDSRWMPHGDWDHATEETYWETAPALDPDANHDLLLVRAIVVEARRRFGVDPRRVYVIGHSNGGFFAEFVATRLASRVAGFAASSAGLVRCATTLACRFQGHGTDCAALRTQRGWCRCNGADRPGPMPASARIPPAYLTHGTSDPLVSVQYTCALDERMTAAGAEHRVVLREGDGHELPARFAAEAWEFLSTRRLP